MERADRKQTFLSSLQKKFIRVLDGVHESRRCVREKVALQVTHTADTEEQRELPAIKTTFDDISGANARLEVQDKVRRRKANGRPLCKFLSLLLIIYHMVYILTAL